MKVFRVKVKRWKSSKQLFLNHLSADLFAESMEYFCCCGIAKTAAKLAQTCGFAVAEDHQQCCGSGFNFAVPNTDIF